MDIDKDQKSNSNSFSKTATKLKNIPEKVHSNSIIRNYTQTIKDHTNLENVFALPCGQISTITGRKMHGSWPEIRYWI